MRELELEWPGHTVDRDTGALFRSGASSLMTRNLNADEGPGGPNHDVHIKLKLSSTLLRAYVEHAGPPSRRLCQWLISCLISWGVPGPARNCSYYRQDERH